MALSGVLQLSGTVVRSIHTTERVTMSEALNIETEDVYEAPMVTEAGNFTELTQGTGRPFVEGPNSLYGPL